MEWERRVPLSYAIELIVAVAAGLALGRATEPAHRFDEMFANFPKYIQYGVYLTDFCDPICNGLVLVEGAALWIETIRRRKPFAWGFGRLTWSVSFFVIMLSMSEEFVWIAAREEWSDALPATMGAIFGIWRDWFTGSAESLLTRTVAPLCLAGLLVTSLAARWPRDPSPDAREWTGRIFFGALILIYLTQRTLSWYWE
jgi:hypothetical protein